MNINDIYPEETIHTLYWRLNQKRATTPEAVIDALMYSFRQRGVAAFKEPANVERLARCDEAARGEMRKRIAKLKVQP